MRRTAQAAAVAFALHAAPVLAQVRPLATPAIDRELYREGEVKRIDRVFSGWHMECDDIRRLHQRFCSMRSRAFDGRGNPVADIVISTADTGQPAALVTLAYGTVLSETVNASLAIPGKAPQLVGKLVPLYCSAEGCKIVWQLGPATITALRNGIDIAFNFKSSPTPASFPGPRAMPKVEVNGRLAGLGFGEALQASLK